MVDVRFANLGISLGLYSRISPSFRWGIFSHLREFRPIVHEQKKLMDHKQRYVPLDSSILPSYEVTLLYSAIQQLVPVSSLDRHNRIHTSKFSSLTGHVLCLSPRFIKYSMKTSASYKENTAFSSVVMTWRYRDRELITASSFKLVKAGNMSWILGLDSKSLKQNHSWSSLSILNNWNSIHVYFR